MSFQDIIKTIKMRIVLLIIELLLFSGFVYVVIAWFRNTTSSKVWELQFIKYGGLLFMLSHLFACFIYDKEFSLFFLIGIGLLFCSGFLFIWSMLSFGKEAPAIAFSDEIVRPLNTSGAYQFIRHPFYTSYSLAWLGGTIATQTWLLLLSFVCMGFIYLKAARQEEEQWLTGSNSTEYAHYIFRTGMFLPSFYKMLF